MTYLIGSILLGIWGWIAWRILYLRLKGRSTVGTVVKLIKDDTGDGTVYFPVIAFDTAEGLHIEAKSVHGTEEAGGYFCIGDKVNVIYSPNNPQLFAIKGYDSAALVFLTILTIAFAAIAWQVVD
ncbi:DUF3592 domain-containing protein [Hymenobacter koreensis]|uniref:DUF3592 domain-containing protein n=1 Tax=Hymenobacter koreensis TaxID=1084523 RepID=A0ABP8J761_9BACT